MAVGKAKESLGKKNSCVQKEKKRKGGRTVGSLQKKTDLPNGGTNSTKTRNSSALIRLPFGCVVQEGSSQK